MEWPEPDAVVIRDVFPAILRAGPLTLRNARVVITRQRIYAWTQRTAPALAAAYDPLLSTVPPLNAARSRRTVLTLTDGTGVTIDAQRGCGCGNPVKSWTPWRPYRKGTV